MNHISPSDRRWHFVIFMKSDLFIWVTSFSFNLSAFVTTWGLNTGRKLCFLAVFSSVTGSMLWFLLGGGGGSILRTRLFVGTFSIDTSSGMSICSPGGGGGIESASLAIFFWHFVKLLIEFFLYLILAATQRNKKRKADDGDEEDEHSAPQPKLSSKEVENAFTIYIELLDIFVVVVNVCYKREKRKKKFFFKGDTCV